MDSVLPKNVALILGFFDGVHAGHRDVINNTGADSKVVVTFKNSPNEYFGRDFVYIYPREHDYKLMEELGVEYIYEQDFAEIVNMPACDYLNMLKGKFSPKSITTGFNHTFGVNRNGNADFLIKNQKGFIYYSTEPTIIDEEIVNSTRIKELLVNGYIEKANKFLVKNFVIKSKVIEGRKLGRELGYPTANMLYPKDIVKIPYGVYKVKTLGEIGVLNWGIKPTIGSEPILELHIPNFCGDLYGKNLEFEVVSKIRDEKRFESLDDLKMQIEKDVKICLEL